MHTYDVSLSDFDEKVISASFLQPVVIDFWAPWCGPCKVLKPLLEKLAEEYGGKFLLAKVNSDENPELSARFKVRGIPAVKAMVDGRIVDEFSGAQPEGVVREWLDGVVPGPVEVLRRAALELAASGDLDGASQKLEEASTLAPANEWVRADSAEILLAKGEVEEAAQLLDSLKDVDVVKDARVAQLTAQARVAKMAAGGGDEAALAAAIAADESDLASRLKLANLLVASRRYEEGMDQLLEIIRRDRAFEDDIGRRTLLDVFNLLAGQRELVAVYRRRLASLLN